MKKSQMKLLPLSAKGRQTYILKLKEVTQNGTRFFIANRSGSPAGYFYLNKRLVAWYEFDSTLKNAKIFMPNDYDILETLPLDNWNHRHQAEINRVKKPIIARTGLIECDEIMCNELFKNSMDKVHKKLKELYLQAYSDIYKLSDQEVYAIIKDLWFPDKSDYIFQRRYYLMNLLMKYDRYSYEYNKILVAIFLKNYLLTRISYKYPFDKGNLWSVIHSTIKNNTMTIKIREEDK